ncbi:membrane protein [Streptomyces viridochromogenes]|uniref:Membrane protein n=1 Tax=Streptomyces viridochromogenes TaxID=1938 RepID=A0A0J7Z190_STRVR|nr:membrane protein [Streptomyces viridochromogenes]KOG15821.1 membrane protein [Streptomyces viridochromogenes]KOG21402.1 membrane protein [Streptomyces viridochromogenes]
MASPRPRRRGRTALLIAGAVVLGLVAGTCAGYLVQAEREPTRLPSLSQPTLKQAEGEAPEPLSAAQDRRVKTDGDLRKLLLKKPAGAKDTEWLTVTDGWQDMASFASNYDKPDMMFEELVSDEFRRAAVTGWQVGSSYTVEIRLVQFRQVERVSAPGTTDNDQYWAEDEDSTDSWPIPDTGEGMAYVHNKPETEAGYLPLYSAEAHAWRGDIAMQIWVYADKPISKKKIMDLAQRQMGRL